jgi:uncharacterized protein (TIGR02145 family)
VPYSNQWSVTTSSTLAETATRPSTYGAPDFIIWGSSYRNDWVKIHNDDLWWDITDTLAARQWPCPSWWHVPTTLEWGDLFKIWCQSRWWTLGQCTISALSGRGWGTLSDYNSTLTLANFKSDLKLPFAAYRQKNSGSVDGQGGIAYYRSSSSDSSVRILRFNSSVIRPQDTSNSGNAYAIRCFKN